MNEAEYTKAIAAATDAAQLQEISKTFMEDAGLHPHRLRGSIETISASPAPAPVARPVRNDREPTCLRVIYPHDNARIEISGMSETELDAIQARIEASFNQ